MEKRKKIAIVLACVFIAAGIAMAIVLPLVLLGGGKSGTDKMRAAYSNAQSGVKAYETLELGFYYDERVSNPYDSAVIEMNAEITLPDNTKQSVPMFYFMDYERTLRGDVEYLSPVGEAQWRLRYTPTQSGKYRVSVKISHAGKNYTYPQKPVEVNVASGNKDAFLQVASDKKHLEFSSTGNSYVGIGHNLCGWEWAGVDNMRGTYDYDSWYASMKKSGANLAQFDLCEGDNIEWTQAENELPISDGYGGVGVYNQQAAFKADHKTQGAIDNDIYYRFSLFHWEDFDNETSSFPTWGWSRNPYNKANGGPSANVSEFFTTDASKKAVKNYFRYAVARWGYSPNLIAWELWNEADAPEVVWKSGDNYYNQQNNVAAWHDEMAKYIKSLDVNRHLVTTSFANSENGSNIWQLASIDITTFHRYSMYNGGNQAQYDGIVALNDIITSRHAAFQKPVIGGEFALSPGGDIQRDNDPDGIGFHNQLWASLFSGSMGTAMHWTWGSYIDRNDLYYHYKPLSLFMENENLTGLSYANDIRGSGDTLQMTMNSAVKGYAWVKDRNYDFKQVCLNGYVPITIENASVQFKNMSSGEYTAFFFDTLEAKQLSSSPVTVTSGTATVEIPAFKKDIAVKLVKNDELYTMANLGAGKPLDSVYQSGDGLKMYAAGTDIGGLSDNALFAYKSVTGDFDYTVRLDSLSYTGEKAKAGIMVRQTTAASSKMVTLCQNGIGSYGVLQRQSSMGTQSEFKPFDVGGYLKIERRGNTIRCLVSSDGKNFSLVETVEFVTLNDTLLVGVTASAHNALAYNDAAFSMMKLVKK